MGFSTATTPQETTTEGTTVATALSPSPPPTIKPCTRMSRQSTINAVSLTPSSSSAQNTTAVSEITPPSSKFSRMSRQSTIANVPTRSRAQQRRRSSIGTLFSVLKCKPKTKQNGKMKKKKKDGHDYHADNIVATRLTTTEYNVNDDNKNDDNSDADNSTIDSGDYDDDEQLDDELLKQSLRTQCQRVLLQQQRATTPTIEANTTDPLVTPDDGSYTLDDSYIFDGTNNATNSGSRFSQFVYEGDSDDDRADQQETQQWKEINHHYICNSNNSNNNTGCHDDVGGDDDTEDDVVPEDHEDEVVVVVGATTQTQKQRRRNSSIAALLFSFPKSKRTSTDDVKIPLQTPTQTPPFVHSSPGTTRTLDENEDEDDGNNEKQTSCTSFHIFDGTNVTGRCCSQFCCV